jgi:hypothetical protein
MLHALSTPSEYFKNKSGLHAWNKVCAYACMMRAEKGVYVCIKVMSEKNCVLVMEPCATCTYSKALNKFDKMFTSLKSWCEKLKLESDVQGVEFEIVTPTKERKFLGRHVRKYTLPSKTDQKQLYIQWPPRDKQTTGRAHEEKTQEAQEQGLKRGQK